MFDVKIENVALDLYIYFVYLCILKSLCIGLLFSQRPYFILLYSMHKTILRVHFYIYFYLFYVLHTVD